MSILIQSKTLSITEALRAYIEQQVPKLLRRSNRIQTVSVFLETIGKRKKHDPSAMIARIKLSVPGRDVVVEKRAANLYHAITEVTLSAARQLEKVKARRLHRRPGFRLVTA